LHHAPGFISGHVNLDMYQENVNLVNIRNRFSNEVYNPDENGNYLIPAYHGLNIISAELEGYICSVDSLAVDVIGGQTSSGNDFFLQRLCAPINLTYSIQENILTLNWDVEGATERYLVPDYYKIWIRMNSFNFQDTSPEQTYSRVLQVNGNYQIFVCSVFLVNGFEEAFSIPSNTLVFNFTPNQDEIEIPKVLTLDQNHPNPFNPKTRISFALPAKSDVSLTIYNLKGQVVKNLINSELDSGYHHADWNGKDNNNVLAASGIYYYRIRWKGKEITRKMILLK